MVVYLIGFMGCGKSTLGKQLARKMLLSFIDMDSYIEERESMTVPEIFEKRGEPYFREVERAALSELSAKHNVVIATGGGVAAAKGNIEFMNSTGVTIYLKMNSGVLLSRITNSKSVRPIFTGKSKEEAFEIIEKMLLEREPFYERATAVVEGKDIKVNELIDKIKEVNIW